MLQLLQYEAGSTLTHDESVTAGAEWATGVLGIIIACAQRMHGIETTHSTGDDGSLGTSADNHICLTQTDEVE